MGLANTPVKDLSKVIKIDVLSFPEHLESGEGEYEVKFGNRPTESEYHDIMSMTKFLNKLWPERADDILSRLQNFGKAYLNLERGEITS